MPRSTEAPKRGTSRLAIPFVLLILGLLAFVFTWRGALDNGLVWDSLDYVFGFAELTDPSVANLRWLLTSYTLGNWHPLTMLSYMLDHWLHGGWDARGLHLTSLLLHAVNSLLVASLALMLFRIALPAPAEQQSNSSPAPVPLVRADPARVIGALLAGLWFGLHPQHVESVAWVAERKDVLFLLFLLLATLAYLRSVTREPGWPFWYLMALAAFVLALMSKPMALSFPLLLLLLDVWPLRRWRLAADSDQPRAGPSMSLAALVIEKLPFLLLSLALVWVTLQAQQVARVSWQGLPLEYRLLNAADGLLYYLRSTLLPMVYTPFHAHPYLGEPELSLADFLPLAGCLGLTLLALLGYWRGRPMWLVLWLFLLVSLAPVIGLVQVGLQGVADRYAYLPTLPLYLLAGAALTIQMRRLRTRSGWLVLALPVLLISVYLSNLTRGYLPVWKDGESLWRHAVAVEPDNGFARTYLGRVLLARGSPVEALEHFNAALAEGELFYNGYDDYSAAALAAGDYRQAQRVLRLILEQRAVYGLFAKREACFRYRLGWTLARLGQLEAAHAQLSQIPPASDWARVAERLDEWLARSEIRIPDEPPDSEVGRALDLAVWPVAYPGRCDAAPG